MNILSYFYSLFMQQPENWVEASYNSNSPIVCRESKTLLDAMPLVTALSWSIVDSHSTQLIAGKCHSEKREVASLTKIMTAYIVIDLSEHNALTPLKHTWRSANTRRSLMELWLD